MEIETENWVDDGNKMNPEVSDLIDDEDVECSVPGSELYKYEKEIFGDSFVIDARKDNLKHSVQEPDVGSQFNNNLGFRERLMTFSWLVNLQNIVTCSLFAAWRTVNKRFLKPRIQEDVMKSSDASVTIRDIEVHPLIRFSSDFRFYKQSQGLRELTENFALDLKYFEEETLSHIMKKWSDSEDQNVALFQRIDAEKWIKTIELSQRLVLQLDRYVLCIQSLKAAQKVETRSTVPNVGFEDNNDSNTDLPDAFENEIHEDCTFSDFEDGKDEFVGDEDSYGEDEFLIAKGGCYESLPDEDPYKNSDIKIADLSYKVVLTELKSKLTHRQEEMKTRELAAYQKANGKEAISNSSSSSSEDYSDDDDPWKYKRRKNFQFKDCSVLLDFDLDHNSSSDDLHHNSDMIEPKYDIGGGHEFKSELAKALQIQRGLSDAQTKHFETDDVEA